MSIKSKAVFLTVCIIPLHLLLTPAILAQKTFTETPQQKEQRMQWWRDARFGLFVHWGPCSVKGQGISWIRIGPRAFAHNLNGKIPMEVYDNLYKEFNPVKFDAEQWVQMMKDAGMKYIVFCTKHHDGFCNFDTKLTDYKITSPLSPYGKDLAKQLADACHKAGIGLGFYYSPPDWHHPDCGRENHSRYIEFLHGQIRELCTNYGKVDIMWFDGLSGKVKDWDSVKLFELIHELQPGIIINDRLDLNGDFSTPEHEVGAFNNTRPWESCITIARSWAYMPDDKVKSAEKCMGILIKTVGGDGNLLLNVGPRPDGLIEPEQVKVLKQLGDWLKKYGESVYGTRGGPYKPGNYGACTSKNNVIYLHITSKADFAGKMPPLNRKIIKSELLTGGKVKVSQTSSEIKIDIPAENYNCLNTVVKLTLDGPASDILPILVPSNSLAAFKEVTVSSFKDYCITCSGRNCVDDDITTAWFTNDKTESAWIEFDLGSDTKFNLVRINEAGPGWASRSNKFELKYKKSESAKWHTIVKDEGVGTHYEKSFAPVKGRYVRLEIPEKGYFAPAINEFQLFYYEGYEK